MNAAIYFKWLQRKNRFRNPECIIELSNFFDFSRISNFEHAEIQKYLDELSKNKISYTYPSHIHYPQAFYFMKEPPLFIEYLGEPVWNQSQMFSVVGSRKCHLLTQQWIQTELKEFIIKSKMTAVSGGAVGVDQAVHITALKAGHPTIVVVPCGLMQMYPKNLIDLKEEILFQKGAYISEFEMNQKVQKSYFYLRNRLIAALGNFCLVAQATTKSGTLLTVHHALEFGKPIVTIPAHPQMIDFSGNQKLAQEGAALIYNSDDLHVFWHAESWSGPVFKNRASTCGVQNLELAL